MKKLYKRLLRKHGRQKWWPTITGNKFEVCVGAILTQNTSWKNVEKALANLINEDAMSPEKITAMRMEKLQRLVRPSGFFRQKAKRLKEFSRFVLSFGSLERFLSDVTREELLDVKGIGEETADSMLLYACGKPYFVVDAYTRRLLADENVIRGDEKYDYVRNLFESSIDRDVELYKQFHALIVVDRKTKGS